MAGGRRGTISLMYEIVISLVLLALFGVTIFLYINANATGEAYWGGVYTADLGTTAEVVNAGYGDVLLRYDNLKPNLDLTFWADMNGLIAVYRTPISITNYVRESVGADTDVPEMPSGIRLQHYGLAKEFPQPDAFTNPDFLVLRKVEKAFAITEAELELTSHEPTIPLQDANVYIEADEAIKSNFSAFIRTSKIHLATKEAATITIVIQRTKNPADKIVYAATNEDGEVFASIFTTRLSLLALKEFEANEPEITKDEFAVHITIHTDASDEDIGRAAAFALMGVYA